VKRERWNDVAIEVLHYPGHTYSVDRMIQSVKDSLDDCTKNFGPYWHRQVRSPRWTRRTRLPVRGIDGVEEEVR
jgi:hypothetical protein